MRKLALLLFLSSAVASAAPVISNVYITNLTSSTATIQWQTSTPSSSQILYGLNQGSYLPYSTNTDHTLVTSHTMTLTVLTPGQMYSFAVVSADGGGSSQSSIYTFSLCGNPVVPVTFKVNQYYLYGGFTVTWVPPAGAVGTPTACGQAIQTTVTGPLDFTGSGTFQVMDASKITPGPGTWQVAAQDVGNLSPISITYPITQFSQEITPPLQTAAASAGLVFCWANTISHHGYPTFCGGGGGGGILTETNSVANLDQTYLNLENGPGITVTNTSGGNVQFASTIIQPQFQTNNVNNTSQILLNFTNTPTITFSNPSGGVETATCSTSTSSALGCVKPDNTTITISGGVLTAVGGGGPGTVPAIPIVYEYGVQTSANQIFAGHPVPVTVTVPSSCTGSAAKTYPTSNGGSAPTATGSVTWTFVDFTTSTTLCSFAWSASGSTATVSGSGGTINSGDSVGLVGATTADATLANVGAEISGTTPGGGGGGGSGFPITIGSTIIGSGSTTTAISGLTIDGVSPTTMGYVDATSSIQTQLNGKQAALGFTPTNAAVVPSTAPAAGQILVGNAGGTAYAPTSMNQDCTITSTGAITCLKTNGAAFTNLATLTGSTAGDVIYFNGSTWARLAGNTSGTKSLQENASGTPSWGTAGTVGGSGTGLVIPMWSGSGASTALTNSHVDDGLTTANTVTSSEPFVVNATALPSQFSLTYDGITPTVGSATTAVYAVNSSGIAEVSNAGAAFSSICVQSGSCHGVLSFATGALTAIVSNGQFNPVKIYVTATLQNIEATAASFTCSTNPTVTLEDCGTSAGACSSPTALGSVTVTAANTITDGSITSATLTSGHYVAWETTAGSCTALNISGSGSY